MFRLAIKDFEYVFDDQTTLHTDYYLTRAECDQTTLFKMADGILWNIAQLRVLKRIGTDISNCYAPGPCFNIR